MTEPAKRRLLLVFAHPDDESVFAGGVACGTVAERGRVALCTATPGEQGKLGDPPMCPRERLGAVRQAELMAACTELGIRTVRVLGYPDRGLASAPPDTIRRQRVVIIRAVRPQVDFTLDPYGSAGTLIQFVNQVAERVEREFPHVWIETLAYQYTRKPPKTIRPRHNVVPRLCTIECDFSQPLDKSSYPQNVRFVQDIKGWSAITDKLYVWDYTTNFHNFVGPHPNFPAIPRNIRFFRDNRVVGLFEQGANDGPYAEFGELRAWLIAKLLWNPDQLVDALLDDFFAGYYGAAAGPIREYFDKLQTLALSAGMPVSLFLRACTISMCS